MDVHEACGVLGFSGGELPDDEALRKAFKREALKHHPDKNIGDEAGAAARFQRVKEASEVIRKAKQGGGGTSGTVDEDEEWANFFSAGAEVDEVLTEIFVRMHEQDHGQYLTPKQRKHLKVVIGKMRRREALLKADREAEAKRAKAQAEREEASMSFWSRQYAAGGRSLREGGVGCYLSWDPRQLTRELQKRKIRLPKNRKVLGLATLLLEDDERRASLEVKSQTTLVLPSDLEPPPESRAVPEGWQKPAATTGAKIDAGIRRRKQAKQDAERRHEEEAQQRLIHGCGGVLVVVVGLVMLGVL